jgi:beta-xylosidase
MSIANSIFELTDSQISIASWKRYYLRAIIDHERLQFSASAEGRKWQLFGPSLETSKLSDDSGQELHFTGSSLASARRTCAAPGPERISTILK